ncbi:hypothetical protein PCANC_27499 [Puccinia coronata f. sp. avenae]|uniref:AB hydrolase-1 domain-containing protein n=1 Tax=Puccinia coronata f. sp. avenae TaxID=200324 RepID=A0A2N5TL90_9BASI|nr:hypothetical protein PCANC_27499 [Puccinia coronata f. sp. avenae]
MAQQSPDILPTILEPETCVKKGLCTVAQGRAVQTHQLYYELHGTLDGAQKMLFVMGLNNSCQGWSNQVKHFSRKPDHSVLVFDNRGVGNSDAGPMGIYKTSEMAKDAEDLMKHLGWTQERSVHLIGVSMGGMISQELCLLVPKRFKSVSFVSTKAGDKLDLPPLKGLYMLTRLISRTVSEQQSIEMLMDALFPEEFLAQPTEGGRTQREEMEANLVERMRKTRKQPAKGMMGQVSAVLRHSCPAASLDRMARELAPAKLLVLTGDRDQLIHTARSDDLHQALPGSELLRIPGAGHAICSQLPDQFNALLERVMEEGNTACA